MARAPLVSVLVLACNKARMTQRCLEALLATDYPRVELWLVDNGSSDNTPEVFDRTAAEATARDGWCARRIDFPDNVGAVAGRNAALEQVRGDYVAFVDNDVVVAGDAWLRACVDRMERDPRVGVLGPKLVFPRPAHMLQCAGCAVTPTGRVQFVGRGEDARAPEYNTEREVQCLISACWVLRGSVLREAGLLDMAYHPVQFEDIDYCYRVRERGYRALYFPGAMAYHYENVTTDGTAGLNYRYVTVRNGLTFKRRWRHRFAVEGGPADETVVWKELPRVSWEEVEAQAPSQPDAGRASDA